MFSFVYVLTRILPDEQGVAGELAKVLTDVVTSGTSLRSRETSPRVLITSTYRPGLADLRG